MDIYDTQAERDEDELAARLGIASIRTGDFEKFHGAFVSSLRESRCWESFTTTMRHLALIPVKNRIVYWQIIESLTQQIVLQKNAENLDPAAVIAKFNCDGIISDLLASEKYRDAVRVMEKAKLEGQKVRDRSAFARLFGAARRKLANLDRLLKDKYHGQVIDEKIIATIQAEIRESIKVEEVRTERRLCD